MKIASLIMLGGLHLAIGWVKAADIKTVEGTMSPKGVEIVLVSTPTRDTYKFLDSKSRQFIGEVLPSDWEGVPNVRFVADWNSDATKLALLFLHGTKLSDFYLYTFSSGQMKSVPFDEPDPLKVYQSSTGKAFDTSESSGADCNSLGPWSDDSV